MFVKWFLMERCRSSHYVAHPTKRARKRIWLYMRRLTRPIPFESAGILSLKTTRSLVSEPVPRGGHCEELSSFLVICHRAG